MSSRSQLSNLLSNLTLFDVAGGKDLRVRIKIVDFELEFDVDPSTTDKQLFNKSARQSIFKTLKYKVSITVSGVIKRKTKAIL